MAQKFKVNTLLLSGNIVTANSSAIYVNGVAIQPGGSVAGLISTGDADLRYLISGASGQFYLKSNPNNFSSSGNVELTGTSLQNQITNALGTKVTGVSISGSIGITGALNINAGANVTLTQVGENGFSIISNVPNGLLSTGSHSLINSVTGVSISGGLSLTGNFNISAGSNISLNQQGSNTLQINSSIPQGFLSSGDADNKYSTITNLNLTGANSLNRDITLSGLIESTGTSLQNQVNIINLGTGNLYPKNNPNNFTHSGYVNLAVTGWQSKSIYIENPMPGDNITLFCTQNAIQVQKLRSIVKGEGLASGLFSIRSDPDKTAAGTELLVNGFSVTGRGTGDNFINFSNTTISGNNWVWLFVQATGQTLSGLHETLFYINL